ncbi:CHAT domain-containing tetratricopeptide repeat protein [Aureispira anguillae]|uniref:CHAT domain-containing protein n=1 Tax=Aureispira anguillae TaxID=2864201 RepID=A0A916DV32_9BACT|nr:CHAT domain-containing tetratricopeptide repeat protein [Aureispira anguillae]BDS13317.1 CHAT domain-containing protein [Aureispira anguillae]
MKYIFIVFSCFLGSMLYAQDDLNPQELIQYSFDELDTLYKHSQQDFQAALIYAQVLANKAKLTYGEADTTYGVRLISLGMQHYYLGSYQKTVEAWTRAKEIFESSWGVEDPEYISVLGNIALLYYYLGNYKDSEALTLEVKAIRARTVGKKHEEYAFILNNLGLLYWRTGRYDKAEGIYLEAKQIMEQTIGETHQEYANVISNLASLYYEMGRHEEVEPLYLQTKEIMAKTQGTEHPRYTACLTNLAGLYITLDEPQKAEKLYLEAQDISKRTIGKEHPEYSIGLHSLGVLYYNTNRLKEALVVLLEAKQLLAKSVGTKYHEYLSVLNSLGRIYLKMGALEQAHQACLEAKNTSTAIFGKRHQLYFTSLYRLTSIHIAQKKYTKAWDLCWESIASNTGQAHLNRGIDEDWSAQLLEAVYFSKTEMENTLETMYQLLGREQTIENLKKQIIVASLAVDLLEKNRQEYIGESDQLRLLSQSGIWTNRAIEVLAKLESLAYSGKNKALAFQFAERNKSVLLYNAIQTERAYVFGGLPDSLVLKEKNLYEEKLSLKAALLEELPKEEEQELQKELVAINLDLNAFKEEVELKYPKYSQLKYQQSTISVEALQAALDEKTAMIEYVISDSLVYIFYIDQQEIDLVARPIRKHELTEAIQKMHAVLSGYQFVIKEPKLAYYTYAKYAHWLYQELLAPVLKGKEQLQNLVIITDGELGHLPFETFLVEDAAQKEDYKKLHYLLNDYTVSYAYSALLWKENQRGNKKRQAKYQMLALAAAYNLSDTANLDHLLPAYQTLRKNLHPIVNTQKEVEMLANSFDGTFLKGAPANEHFFKQIAKDYSILHLAMHGVLNRRSPALSALAFSENKDGKEDNFLQAYEISQLNLNADLVVLSACETGYGEFEEGNGIASLARSFMYAGVPSLVVSLWPVNDHSTKFIMKGFYDHLKAGLGKAAALRQAKLDYLASAKGLSTNPAFWSPFIQLGAIEPVRLAPKSNKKMYLWMAIGAVVLGAFLFLFWRNKNKEI